MRERVLVGNEPDSCWLWTTHQVDDGYGKIQVGPLDRKRIGAHRVSWYLNNPGGFPSISQVVRHRCDNPPCVNPDHLEIGTVSDNNRDMMIRGRNRPPRGEMNGKSRLRESDVIDARYQFMTGRSTSSIARCLGVAHSLASRIVSGKRWASVEFPLGYFESGPVMSSLERGRRLSNRRARVAA